MDPVAARIVRASRLNIVPSPTAELGAAAAQAAHDLVGENGDRRDVDYVILAVPGVAELPDDALGELERAVAKIISERGEPIERRPGPRPVTA